MFSPCSPCAEGLSVARSSRKGSEAVPQRDERALVDADASHDLSGHLERRGAERGPLFGEGDVEHPLVVRAAGALRHGGALWLTANAHLPYERALAEAFAEVTLRASANGYKVYEARR